MRLPTHLPRPLAFGLSALLLSALIFGLLYAPGGIETGETAKPQLPRATQEASRGDAAREHTHTAACRHSESSHPQQSQAKEHALLAKREQINRELNSFDTWLTAFARGQAPAQGLELAISRRAALKELIALDPKAALEAAVPRHLRSKLPAEIQDQLETPIDSEGQLRVMAACGSRPRHFRRITVGDTSYDAHTYGARLKSKTKERIPVHGIAVDDQLALSEHPFRVLEENSTRILAAVGSLEHSFASAKELTASGIKQLALEAILGPEPLAEETTEAAKAGPQAWIEGTKKILWIRSALDASETSLYDEDLIAKQIGKTNGYYARVSRNRTQFSQVVLPEIIVTGLSRGEIAGEISGLELLNKRVIELAKAYDAAHGNTGLYDPANYDRTVIVTPVMNEWGWAGLAVVGGKGLWLNGRQEAYVLCHELTHNQGLFHSHAWRSAPTPTASYGKHVEYGDSFDIMGNAGCLDGADLNTAQKFLLGYISPEEVSEVNSSGISRLRPCDMAAPTGTLAVKVQATAGHDYWMELRSNAMSLLHNNKALPKLVNRLTEGVIVHWGTKPDFASGEGTYLLDATAGSSDETFDSALGFGESIIDAHNGIRITNVGTGVDEIGRYVDVRVSLGSSPDNQAPLLDLVKVPDTVVAGTAQTLVATASDPDGDELSFEWRIDGEPIPINRSQAPFTTKLPGVYEVTCTVTDGEGGLTKASKHITVTSTGEMLRTTRLPQQYSTDMTKEGSITCGNGIVSIILNQSIFVSTDGISWTCSRERFMEGITKQGCFFKGRHMVASYQYGRVNVHASENGYEWRKLAEINAPPGVGLACNDDCIIILHENGTVSRSTDGQTWSHLKSDTPWTPLSLAQADGWFMASGQRGTLRRSQNGIDWEILDLPTEQTFMRVCKAGERWIAFTSNYSQSVIWSSENGRDWTATPVRDNNEIFYIILAGAPVVPMSGDLYSIGAPYKGSWLSDNGVRWMKSAQDRSTLLSCEFNGLKIYVDTRLGIETEGTPFLMAPKWPSSISTTDSLIETDATWSFSPDFAGFSKIELFVDGILVGSATPEKPSLSFRPSKEAQYLLTMKGTTDDGTSILSTPIPISSRSSAGWIEIKDARLSQTTQHGAVFHDEEGFIAIKGKSLAVSKDGIHWETRSIPAYPLDDTFDLQRSKGRIIAVGRAQSALIASSTDLETWTVELSTGSQSAYFSKLAVGKDGYLAKSNGAFPLYRGTADGKWTPVMQFNQATVADIVANKGLFTVVTSSSEIWSSADGLSWTLNRSGSPPYVTKVIGSRSGWMFVSNYQSCFSSDLKTFDLLSITSDKGFENQAYTVPDSQESFCYGNGFVNASNDGRHWLRFPAPILNSLSYGNGLLIGLDRNGNLQRKGTPLSVSNAPALSFEELPQYGLGEGQIIQTQATGYERVQFLINGKLVAEAYENDPSFALPFVQPGKARLQIIGVYSDGRTERSTEREVRIGLGQWESFQDILKGRPIRDLAVYKGTWLIIDAEGSLLKSTDATNWSPVPKAPTNLRALASSPEELRAIGAEDWKTSDLEFWIELSHESQLTTLVYTRDRWIGITKYSSIVTHSSDGTLLQHYNISSANTAFKTIEADNRTVVYGNKGGYVLIDDLFNFYYYAVDPSSPLVGIIKQDSGFHAIRANGSTFVSGQATGWNASYNIPLQQGEEIVSTFGKNGRAHAYTNLHRAFSKEQWAGWVEDPLDSGFIPMKTATKDDRTLGIDSHGRIASMNSEGHWVVADTRPRSRVRELASNGTTTLLVCDGVDASLAKPTSRVLFRLVPDGQWTPIEGGEEACSIAYGNNCWVAVGGSQNILKSNDGLLFQEQPTPAGIPLVKVRYGSAGFVAIGKSGTILRSLDGANWQSANGPTSHDLIDLTAGADRYLVLADDHSLYHSTDGETWSSCGIHATEASTLTYSSSSGFLLAAAEGTSITRLEFTGTEWLAHKNKTEQTLEGLCGVPHGMVGTFEGQNLGMADSPAHWSPLILPPLEPTERIIPVHDGHWLWLLGDAGKLFRTRYEASGLSVSVPNPEQVGLAEIGSDLLLQSELPTAPDLTCQWFKNGRLIDGATTPALRIANAGIEDSGRYNLVVYSKTGAVTSASHTISIPWSRLVNLSVRSVSRSDQQPLIMGFVTTGGDKPLLMRAWGPALGAFGVAGTLVDPKVDLHDDISKGGGLLADNDDYKNATEESNALQATGSYRFPGYSGKDAQMLQTVNGLRTLYAYDTQGRSGVTLAELTDTDATGRARLVNGSARNYVGTGDDILVLGFGIAGNKPLRLLVRGIGPTLTKAPFNLQGMVADPLLKLYRVGGDSALIGTNDDWAENGAAAMRAAFSSCYAFDLPEDASKDAAFVVELEPGLYTVELHTKTGEPGEALIELYELP